MSGKIEISRELLELAFEINGIAAAAARHEIRQMLAAPVVERQVEGRRERFQKWVLATEHPVLGFLDGHWLERGDDREGYANEYVQGLWVAYKAFASPPAPVAAVLPERKQSFDDFTYDGCRDSGWNACLDKLKELNQ